MFITPKRQCCLLEVICNVGVPVLFLDYTKTAYGSQMYEIILPIGITFKPISKEEKQILTYQFDEMAIQPISSIDKIKPYLDLSYKNPYTKKIQTFLIQCSYN